MVRSRFGVSLEKNRSAVRTQPTDFFGSQYFEPNWNLQAGDAQDYAQAHRQRLERRRLLVGF